MSSAARNVFDIERPLLCTGSKGNARNDLEKGRVELTSLTMGRPRRVAPTKNPMALFVAGLALLIAGALFWRDNGSRRRSIH